MYDFYDVNVPWIINNAYIHIINFFTLNYMRSSTTQRGHFQSISSVLKPTQPRRCQPLHIFYQIQQIYVKPLNAIEFTSSVFNTLLTLCNEQVISSCPVSETVNFSFFSFFFFSFWDQNNHRDNLAAEQIQSSKLLATTDFLLSLITPLILYSGIFCKSKESGER